MQDFGGDRTWILEANLVCQPASLHQELGEESGGVDW